MKFAIVLLGLFALSAAVPQQRGIVDSVESLVNSAISKAQADLDSLISRVQGLTSSAQSMADSIIAAAKAQVASTIDGLEDTIAALITKGGVVAFCAQRNLAQITEFKETFGKNVQSCAGNLSGSLGGFQSTLMGEVASLKGSVADLVAIVQECTTNIFDAIFCAVGKIGQVETLIQTVISEAGQALEAASKQTSAAVNQIQICAQQTVGEATITLNKYVTAVKACA